MMMIMDVHDGSKSVMCVCAGGGGGGDDDCCCCVVVLLFISTRYARALNDVFCVRFPFL